MVLLGYSLQDSARPGQWGRGRARPPRLCGDQQGVLHLPGPSPGIPGSTVPCLEGGGLRGLLKETAGRRTLLTGDPIPILPPRGSLGPLIYVGCKSESPRGGPRLASDPWHSPAPPEPQFSHSGRVALQALPPLTEDWAHPPADGGPTRLRHGGWWYAQTSSS